MSERPIFTIIVHTYERLDFLQEAVQAILRQTYDNLEIIIVSNGAKPDVFEYLMDLESKDQRVEIVKFDKNLFTPTDPSIHCDVIFNAGLKIAQGEYVFYQEDDDVISDNYAEKMVALFQGNPECTTAAGKVVNLDIRGNISETNPANLKNYRPRYMPGHLLAQQALFVPGQIMFSMPGSIFTIRRDSLIKAGGFHRNIDIQHIYGIMPFGDTGYDETAIFHWRRHENQLNVQLAKMGNVVELKWAFSALNDCEIEKRWQVFGNNLAKKVISRYKFWLNDYGAGRFVFCFLSFKINGLITVVKICWRYPIFWFLIPKQLILYPYDKIRNIFYSNIKTWLDIIFRLFPFITNIKKFDELKFRLEKSKNKI